MSVLACSGHLLIDLPIFMGPVVLLVGWLLVMTRRARRAEYTSHGDSTLAPEHADEMRNTAERSAKRGSPMSAGLPEGRLSL